MNVEKRQRIERRIAREAIKGLLAEGYKISVFDGEETVLTKSVGHCCKVSDEAAFCLIQRPYISKTLLTRRISPRGSP